MGFNELTPGDTYEGFAAVKDVRVGEARNETQYLDMVLTDGVKTLPAKCWGHSGEAPRINTVIHIKAAAGQYQGAAQLTLSAWRNVTPGEVNPAQFIPKSKVDLAVLWGEFASLCEMVKDEEYRELITKVLQAYPEFADAPAAKGIHHAYIHGLLEHSIGTTKKAISMTSGTTVNMDLLITGALLHDVGKIFDYDWSGCAITQTDSGKLVGHIVCGSMMIFRAAGMMKMKPAKLMPLLHLIASHHGQKAWGSPVEPQTKEAVILHAADMLDYQMFAINKAKEETKEGDTWTGKTKGMNKEFYIGEVI